MYGQRLRELRKDKKMTQAELAELLKVNQKTVSKYEEEKLDLSTATIIAICKHFEISADNLLGLNEI